MLCYFVCYLKIITIKSLHFQYNTRFSCVSFFFLEIELIILVFLLLNNQGISLVVFFVSVFCFVFIFFHSSPLTKVIAMYK